MKDHSKEMVGSAQLNPDPFCSSHILFLVQKTIVSLLDSVSLFVDAIFSRKFQLVLSLIELHFVLNLQSCMIL